MTRRRPTDDDRHEAIKTALNGLAHGGHLGGPCDPPGAAATPTFPGEVLLDLAADAIGTSGANRQGLLDFVGIRERYLPEGAAHTKAQHHKSKFALPLTGSRIPNITRVLRVRRDPNRARLG